MPAHYPIVRAAVSHAGAFTGSCSCGWSMFPQERSEAVSDTEEHILDTLTGIVTV